ncbi:MAG: hypothetical protein QM539_07730 [Alphaproteobacteria bacterium]|nr:hypothetical protein [Alphaproteobacteria bacterium]
MRIPDFIFYGSDGYPFVAPRGIWIVNNILIVCNTASNQVYIWHQIPTTPYQEPDVVLGKQSGETDAYHFYYPSGVWSDGTCLVVADAWNHRVLIWHTFPQKNFQAADVVVGQKDFTTNFPNGDKVQTAPNAYHLYWCYGVFVHNHSLYIADTGNRRILQYFKIPENNYTPADNVFCQPNFCCRDFNPAFPTWPYSIKISDKQEALITDTQYFRVHYWRSFFKTASMPSDLVFGQINHEDNLQNRGLLTPNAQVLNWVYDALFSNNSNKIYIADTGNSRVLGFENDGLTNALEAQEVFGQKDFNQNGENKMSIMGEENYLYWPFSLAQNEQYLVVCETGNNRIYFYKK